MLLFFISLDILLIYLQIVFVDYKQSFFLFFLYKYLESLKTHSTKGTRNMYRTWNDLHHRTLILLERMFPDFCFWRSQVLWPVPRQMQCFAPFQRRCVFFGVQITCDSSSPLFSLLLCLRHSFTNILYPVQWKSGKKCTPLDIYVWMDVSSFTSSCLFGFCRRYGFCAECSQVLRVLVRNAWKWFVWFVK